MKILLLTNHLKGNDGWSRYTLNLANELKKQGHDIVCLTSAQSDNKNIKEYPILSEPLKYIANPLMIIATAVKVNKIIKSFNPEIVHFIVEPYVFTLPFLSVKQTKTLLTIHGSYAFIPRLLRNPLKKFISLCFTKLAYKKINKIIAVSQYTEKYLLDYDKNLSAKITVVHNGINLEYIAVKNKEESGPRKNILFVGTIKPRKGILETLNILSYYRDQYNDNFIYYIVGDYSADTEYYDSLRRRMNTLGLKNNIIFTGKISDEELSHYYNQADLFLMLPLTNGCRFEGFGLVYLEASARGIPCLGIANSGSEEAIKERVSGYLTDSHDPGKAASKINMILNKNTIKYSDCVNWAKENSVEKQVNQIVGLYKTVHKVKKTL